jgi:hypothetical protein
MTVTGRRPLNGTIFALVIRVMTAWSFMVPAAAAGALFMIAAGPLRAAGDDVIDMRFEGFGLAGMHMVTTRTEIEETPAAYSIRGDVETAGLAGLIVSLQNRSVARGRLSGGAAEPQIFDSETARNGVMQHNRVEYRPDGTPSGSSTPSPTDPVTPIDTGQLRGTVDNLTAYFLVERQLARGDSCEMIVPVFDGRHRYNLHFRDGGDQVLSPISGQNFSGRAHACRMVRQDLGGFFVDKNHKEGADSGTIWYARLLSGDIAVPVRMRMDTEIGGLDFYLAQLKGRGVDLRLMD